MLSIKCIVPIIRRPVKNLVCNRIPQSCFGQTVTSNKGPLVGTIFRLSRNGQKAKTEGVDRQNVAVGPLVAVDPLVAVTDALVRP